MSTHIGLNMSALSASGHRLSVFVSLSLPICLFVCLCLSSIRIGLCLHVCGPSDGLFVAMAFECRPIIFVSFSIALAHEPFLMFHCFRHTGMGKQRATQHFTLITRPLGTFMQNGRPRRLLCGTYERAV